MPNRPAATPDPALARALHDARRLKSERRFKEAFGHYKRILAGHPRCAEALGAIGHIYGLTGQTDRGESLLREAIGLEPGSAELHFLLGQLFTLRIEPAGALPHLERALELEPKRVEALTLAAQCCERLNRLDEARGYAERAVAAKRTDPEANLVLAQLDAKAKAYGAAKARLGKLLGRGSTPPETRHRALTELGFAHDRTGDYDAAFEAFERAGATLAELHDAARVSRTSVFDRLDAYRGRVSAELVGRFAGETFDTPAPAFLVGFPRSGTTMTEQVLAAHPGVVTSDEQPLLDAVSAGLMKGASSWNEVCPRLGALDKPGVEKLRRAYWDRVAERIGPDTVGALVVDKLPLNIIDLPMINTVFPDARVLVALRDPRDCCLSCFQQFFVPNPAMIHTLSLPATVRLYEAVMGLYLETRGGLTCPVLQVRYEDTVSDLEPQARRIIAHLGLDWHDDLLEFHEKARERAIRTPSYGAVTERVHTRAVGRWRNYRTFFEPLLTTLEPFVVEFGYEPG